MTIICMENSCTVVSVINIVPVVTAVGLSDIQPLSAVVLLRHVEARISLIC